jgi:phosphatidylinositol alpha-1,6-mannosyltransferase
MRESLAAPSRSILLAITGAFQASGGIAAVNRLVIRSLADEGYRLEVLALSEENPPFQAGYADATQLHYEGFAGNKTAFVREVSRRLLADSYDLVCSDHVNVAAALLPAKWLGRCRYMVWLCGIEVFAPRPDWEGRLGLTHAWRRLAISTYTRDSVASRFPDLPVQVCDLALDPICHALELPAQPDPARPQLSLRTVDGQEQCLGPAVILMVGRMLSTERYKGHECLLSALPEVVQAFPEAQLVLVGQGDDWLRLKTLALSLPEALRARVFMPGHVGDELLRQLYQACYLFAMPSTGEGFGLVYLEAMSHGRACLGGKKDATPCVVRDGLTGVLVADPSSPQQVTEALRWMLAHPARTAEMGRAGYDLVRSYYLYPHFRERFLRAIS